MWRGQEARLHLHYEDGLKLFPAAEAHTNGDKTPTLPKAYWRVPFGNLRHTADDGVRLLWLDIGSEDGELVPRRPFLRCVLSLGALSLQELDLLTCPKPFVFTLHSFLSAKINRMGVVT